MDNLTSEVVSTLQLLLPGFISAWVFYSLTSFPKQSQFEQVIQALIFTIIVQSFNSLLQLLAKSYTYLIWNERLELFLSIILALILGLVLAYFSNNDKIHKLLRYFKITKETSYASEWFSSFSEKITYIVLHLKDGRRIFGWPKEWPTEPNKGHFYLQDASWLTDKNEEIQLKEVDGILIKGEDVEMVEFMKINEEK